MLKRSTALALALLMTVTVLAGCMRTQTAATVPALELPENVAEKTPSSDASYEDNLDGLCSYLEVNSALARGDNDAAFTEMSYKEIGAVGGYRYRFTCGSSTVQAEFYEFDLENLDEKAQTCISSVQMLGYFTILGNDVQAQLSNSGKYMMIYHDTGKAEVNSLERDWLEKCFTGFKAG